jgi:hypothetical protein
MAFDYSALFKSEDGISSTWREIYDESLSLPGNLLSILKRTIFLPHDHYEIIAAYFLLPSALCKVVPYLFLQGLSGSGKSTVAKVASYLHGVTINSSSDTFAGIRNSLNDRRTAYIEISTDDPNYPFRQKKVERNTCMVWDDVDASVFINSPDLYRLFKFGYDRSTDKIILSSKDVGENLEFRCFCPKIFSSISPLHLDDRFKELKRRMIVIPCKRVEELSDARKEELSVTDNDWQTKLLDITAYNWQGFSQLFEDFWDADNAWSFLTVRKIIGQSVKGLSSQQRAISLDLLATGIASGIWQDEVIAVDAIKSYWSWFKSDNDKGAGLTGLLKQFIAQETANAKAGGTVLMLPTVYIRSQVDIWVHQGWLYERPKGSTISDALLDLGLRLQQGKWHKD